MSAAGLRPASLDDHALYVRFFAELGTPEGPLESSRWQTECVSSSAFLVEAGREVGYAAWELAGENAHVRHVVIEPAARGRGLGRQLMIDLGGLLRSKGAQAWRLNVFSTNATAIGLYEGLGLRAIYSSAVLRLDWNFVARLPCAASRAGDANPAFDAVNEVKFGLLQGQLARTRSKQGVMIVAATAADGLQVGLAAFDPSIPGAFPFRCKPPEHARTLLDGLRERYHGDKPFVQLVIEDSEVITRALELAGAQRLHDIVHMRGSIPR